MKALWKPSKETIGGHPAIELVSQSIGGTTTELGLAGPRGEIWENGPSGYKAVVVRSPSGRSLPNEQLVSFGADELQWWIATLQIPPTSEEQTPFANTFSQRSSVKVKRYKEVKKN
jgi:hypothetical protein